VGEQTECFAPLRRAARNPLEHAYRRLVSPEATEQRAERHGVSRRRAVAAHGGLEDAHRGQDVAVRLENPRGLHRVARTFPRSSRFEDASGRGKQSRSPRVVTCAREPLRDALGERRVDRNLGQGPFGRRGVSGGGGEIQGTRGVACSKRFFGGGLKEARLLEEGARVARSSTGSREIRRVEQSTRAHESENVRVHSIHGG
jgi:hypothetical protein